MPTVQLLPSRSLKFRETEKGMNKRNKGITNKKFSADSPVEQIEISTAAAALRGLRPDKSVSNALFPIMQPDLHVSTHNRQSFHHYNSATSRLPLLPKKSSLTFVSLVNGPRLAHHLSSSTLSASASCSDMRSRGVPAQGPALPGDANTSFNGHNRNVSGGTSFEIMARSPPSVGNKNTKHVPCKFFRQGACQAGPACPFLHSTDAAVDSAPCKYFTKGNCKFGAKCALAHILPDGRRVNRPNYSVPASGGGHLNLGGRVNPPTYHNQDSALTSSVLSQQRMNNGFDARYGSQILGQEDLALLQVQQQASSQEGLLLGDVPYALDSGSKYSSPVDDNRMPSSPKHHLTALDAPLPASFDSQGISHVARYGPVAASMPSKFGLELPSPPSQRQPSDALKSLRDVAFGSDTRRVPSNFGSSPPVPEESLTPRFLHSQRIIRPKALSASVPRPTALDDWDDGNFSMEEDYLPGNLHDDVLTPQERMRRLSRTEQELSSGNRDFSLGMTGSGTAKVVSPLASSPSRFGALFARQRQRKEEEGLSASSWNHVGSPLRESSLNFIAKSPSLRPIGSRPISGDVSPFISSPTPQSSMSMISQQLNNMSLHPSVTSRHASGNGSNININSRFDRAVSSPMTTSRIDEEQSDLVFSMEEEESNKRSSLTWISGNNNEDLNTSSSLGGDQRTES